MSDSKQPAAKAGEQPAAPVPPRPAASLHDVRTAQNSAAFLLPTLHSMTLPNHRPLSILDAGCGSGALSTSLASLTATQGGHLTGIDSNPSALARARVSAENAGVSAHTTFLEGDVFALPFADGEFDVVFCHQVLVHLGEPWRALGEMLRVTKAGGVVAAREGDYATEAVWPRLPGLVKFHELMVGHMGSGGGTAMAGRQLLSWAVRAGAGAGDVDVSYSTTSYTTPAERQTCAQGLCQSLKGGSLRDKALKFGLATEDEMEEMVRAWTEWAERDDAVLAMLQGEIIIHKR